MAAEDLKAIASAMASLAVQAQTLANEVKLENAARSRQNRLTQVLIGCLFVGLVLIGVMLVRQQLDAVERSKVASAQREAQLSLAKTIEDCTNPDGECAKRSGERTAAVIIKLVEQQAIITRCDVASETVPQFEACLTANGVPIPPTVR